MKKPPEAGDLTALTVSEIKEYIHKKEKLTPREENLLKNDRRKAVQQLYRSYQRQEKKALVNRENFFQRSWKELSLQEKGYEFLAGVDEVGRGPLAGPLVAAAVVLDWSEMREENFWYEVNDSKKLSPRKREQLYQIIISYAISIGLGVVEPWLIDRINVYQASLEAMKKAVQQIYPLPQYLLTDGFAIPQFQGVPQEAVKGGDAKCISIAAASIVAKVTRDKLMEQYDKKCPGYGFDRNKGYPTAEHKEALRLLGPSYLHRRSFNLT